MQHGLATSHRRCKDGPNGGPCPECVIAGRAADAERQQRSRDRKKGVTPPERSRPALTLITNKTAGRSTETTSHHDPDPDPRPSHPAEDAGAARSGPERDDTGFDMPHLWPSVAVSPEYAESHRNALAEMVSSVLANPEHVAIDVDACFTEDTNRKERKDFYKLCKEFVKANPDLIIFQWYTDRMWLYSTEYIGTEDEETEETETENVDMTPDISSIPVPEPQIARQTAPQKQVKRPLVVAFTPRARGICTVTVNENPGYANYSWCDNYADGRYTWQSHPVCAECYAIIYRYYPGECKQRRIG